MGIETGEKEKGREEKRKRERENERIQHRFFLVRSLLSWGSSVLSSKITFPLR